MTAPLLWLAPALAAPVLWGASNLVDEHLVRRSIRNSVSLTIVAGAFLSIPGVAVAATGHLAWPGWPTVFLALASGSLGLLVYIPYLEALKIGSPASVMLMWNFTPVLIAIIARFGIGERLTTAQYFGMTLLVISSSLASLRADERGWFNLAFPWMALASVILALSSVAEKAVYERLPFFVGLGWISVGTAITTVALALSFREAREVVIAASRSRKALLLAGNEVLDFGAYCSLEYATSIAPVTLVHAVGGLQPLCILVIARIARLDRQDARLAWLRTALCAGLAVSGLGLMDTGE